MSSRDFAQLVESLLRSGEPIAAYDVAREGLARYSRDLRLRQLEGLSCANCGATARARQLLSELPPAAQRDEETLGILARVEKDFALRALGPRERNRHLRKAFDLYQAAFTVKRGYWPLLNAATVALLLRKRREAFGLARQVLSLCQLRLEGSSAEDGEDYWLHASCGEAELVLGNLEQACMHYRRAVERHPLSFGQWHSSWRNAELILAQQPAAQNMVRSCFPTPRIAVLIGHMIDRPDRAVARFPDEREELVGQAIARFLQKAKVGFGYASAACGSDILFHESIWALGGESHVVLPYPEEQFVKDSVAFLPRSDWLSRYRRVLGNAKEVVVASDCPPQANPVVYDYANALLAGLARLRANQLGASLVPMAVWDGKPGDGAGGTLSAIRQWQQFGYTVQCLEVAGLPRGFPPSWKTLPTKATGPRPRVRRRGAGTGPQYEIVSLLFADARGFGGLGEIDAQRFLFRCFQNVAALLSRSSQGPMTREAWGDSVYFTFKRVKDAGLLALDLVDAVGANLTSSAGRQSWQLDFRVALHAGPAFRWLNPVTRRVGYSGIHVTRAARIEPITPPGMVYASRAFAALATAEGVREFACEYVGRTPWAKNAGVFPTFVLRRS